MATVTQEFQAAPMGRRVIFTTAISFTVILLAFGANFAFRYRRAPAPTTEASRVIVSVAPMLGLLLGVPMFLLERSKVSHFRIDQNCLVLGKRRFPLEGLVGVARDPDVMKRAMRMYGNGGVGAIRGHYRSKRLGGKFYAFLSGTENAVVLRWPNNAVAVSPADPEFFIQSARSAAGLR
jgi:hypothetical protein